MRFPDINMGSRGFTLIELVVVIVVLGIIAAVGIPQIGGMIQASRMNATKSELAELKKAIVGSPQLVAGGTYVGTGFEADVGHPPDRLEDLAAKPDTISIWNRLTGKGWHGPYIDDSNGDYLTDAWGLAYTYDESGRTIISTGSGESITIGF